MSYPTKKEILAIPYPLTPEEQLSIELWNRKVQRGINENDDLCVLALMLCMARQASAPQFVQGAFWKYENGSILMGGRSIISMFHEMGHHFFGSSELDACRYALACYKVINPKLTGLVWKGHLLVKRPPSSRRTVRSRSPRPSSDGSP